MEFDLRLFLLQYSATQVYMKVTEFMLVFSKENLKLIEQSNFKFLNSDFEVNG